MEFYLLDGLWRCRCGCFIFTRLKWLDGKGSADLDTILWEIKIQKCNGFFFGPFSTATPSLIKISRVVSCFILQTDRQTDGNETNLLGGGNKQQHFALVNKHQSVFCFHYCSLCMGGRSWWLLLPLHELEWWSLGKGETRTGHESLTARRPSSTLQPQMG